MPYKDNYSRKMWDKSKKNLNGQIAITLYLGYGKGK